jgi:hypothetical protein
VSGMPIIPANNIGGYQISRSLRFRSSASTTLTKSAPASNGNLTKGTISVWIKRCGLGGLQRILDAGDVKNNMLCFNDTTSGISSAPQESLAFIYNTIASNTYRYTSAVFRDPSAWMHIVLAVDTNAASGSRVKIYVNGISQALSGNEPAAGSNLDWASTVSGFQIGSSANFLMAHLAYVNGQQLTPASFAGTDATTGQWIPIDLSSLTFGTNGFWLKLNDNSGTTSTTLGKDSSGNSFNFTPNNFSVTAGTTNDSLVDSPTNSGSDTGAGGEVRGNYATYGPLCTNSAVTLSDGNLKATATGGSANYYSVVPFSMLLGDKWYWELTYTGSGNYTALGVTDYNNLAPSALTDNWNVLWTSAGSCFYNNSNGIIYKAGVSQGAQSSYTTNDIIGVAFNYSGASPTIQFYKNGVAQGSAITLPSSAIFYPTVDVWVSGGLTLNAGQRPFAYTAPSGFKALCTQNLTTPAIALPNSHFDVVVRTGTGASASVSSLAFKPDVVWIKSRSNATDHALLDGVRGAANVLFPNLTLAEDTTNAYGFAFTSNGYSYNSSATINGSGRTYVDWCWKGGNSSGSSNTSGTITSTVSANTTAGFSVVRAASMNSGTVGHGLGVVPSMIIGRMTAETFNWHTWHTSLSGGTYGLKLNLTDAQSVQSTIWTGLPTSSVINVGSSWTVGNPAIFYCFAAIPGFSAFGSYTGNGSADGPFVFCGFRPRWLMIKRTDAAGVDWIIHDTSRDTYNSSAFSQLFADLSAVENSGGSNNQDILSNGFKLRDSAGNDNTSGGTYIYAAFAENPFKYSRAR